MKHMSLLTPLILEVFEPDILQEVEKQVCIVRENLRVAQSR
jgi:hypothetical protein